VLSTFPVIANARAVTLGHTILARTEDDANHCRAHEQEHVRQYERWGPLFGFVYVGWMIALRLRGRDPYYDNPFEKAAFDAERRGRTR
jgi:hypothetical protein